MRKLLLSICCLGLTYAAQSQSNQSSGTMLNNLKPGQNIQIVEANSMKHTGVFVAATDTAVTYSESTGQHSVQKQEIRSVKLLENRHRLRNTFIGAGIGVGVGAAIGGATACSGSSCFFGRRFGVAVGAGFGVVPGAIVGLLIPSHDTVYTAPKP